MQAILNDVRQANYSSYCSLGNKTNKDAAGGRAFTVFI